MKWSRSLARSPATLIFRMHSWNFLSQLCPTNVENAWYIVSSLHGRLLSGEQLHATVGEHETRNEEDEDRLRISSHFTLGRRPTNACPVAMRWLFEKRPTEAGKRRYVR